MAASPKPRAGPLPTSVAAEDLLIHDGGDGQTVEAVGERFPELDVVPPLACKAVGVGGYLVLPLWGCGAPHEPPTWARAPHVKHTQLPRGPPASAELRLHGGSAMGWACVTQRVSSGCRLIEVVGRGGTGVRDGHGTLHVGGAGSTGVVRVGCGYEDGTGAAGGHGGCRGTPPGHSSCRRGWCRTAWGRHGVRGAQGWQRGRGGTRPQPEHSHSS